MVLESLQQEIRTGLDEAVEAICTSGQLEKGSLIVLGCSTSEVAGAVIGHGSVPELGEVIAKAMIEACHKRGMHPLFQCCEHLNRAVVMEKEVLRTHAFQQVRAIPQPKAGGSVPAAAWKMLDHPVLSWAVQADGAIDIGDTLVGMHIRPVAVPLRIQRDTIGQAHLVLAYSRLPYIGGSRAVYE